MDKAPRLRPHERIIQEEDLGVIGIPVERPIRPPTAPVRQLGGISLTDGVMIPREAPEKPEPTSGVGWPE